MIELVLKSSDNVVMVSKSTLPVGHTTKIRERFGADRTLFSPEFLRESKAEYDNLYPSRIIVGSDENTREAAEIFAKLLVEGAKKKDVEVLHMGLFEAEAVKLFANTYLALRVGYFNELDTYAEMKGFQQLTSTKATVWIRVSEIITTIQASVMVIVCRRTRSSFWPITMMFRRT